MSTRVGVAIAVVLGVVLLGAWLARPSPRRPPSPGRALQGGALVVWSSACRVSFFGLERLHAFDIRKYDRIAAGLVARGQVDPTDFAVAAPIAHDVLATVHDPTYLRSLDHAPSLSRALEVPVPSALAWAAPRWVLEPFRVSVGGTLLAARGAMEHGVGINLGGGYHHAGPAKGHGFCVYNDVAVAVSVLRSEGLQGTVLIVDTDAHQGDGTHAFFADDPTVYSWSIHQGDAFPIPKRAGDEDHVLARGAADADLNAVLEERLPQLIEALDPAMIVHVAGADVLYDDPLTDLALTVDGLVLRDRIVLQEARRSGVPLLHVLAGGYGPSAAEAQLESVSAMLADMSPSVSP